MAKGLDNVQFPKSLQDQWVFSSTGEKLSTLRAFEWFLIQNTLDQCLVRLLEVSSLSVNILEMRKVHHFCYHKR